MLRIRIRMPPKRFLNSHPQRDLNLAITLDGAPVPAATGELLVETINRALPGRQLAQVCYHPQMGPIESCDTCIVEVNGKLVRACATEVADGMTVATSSDRADVAQREAFDRILENHQLYCTVCDNNNGNCTVHNTTGGPRGEAPGPRVSREALRSGSFESVSTVTTRTNASCAADAWRPARTCR